MSQDNSINSDRRGVSNVVAVTLLIGLTLVGVIVILATGWVSIGETNQQADMQIAEESMLQIDSSLAQSSGGSDAISFPDELKGNVAVSSDAKYNLTLNENPKCSTGERNLSSISYSENGQSVAYEGGGVWKMTESGSTMVSPPDVTYSQGSLSVSVTKIDGQIETTNELRVTTNTTNQLTHQANLSRALYTEGTYTTEGPDTEPVCPRSQVENATLSIQDSQYARAWAQWARDNHDSSLVTVPDPSTVSSGDPVNITYQLGDVSPTNFTVSDVRATRASTNGDVTVEATVTNTGGLRNNQTVSFDYAAPNETGTDSELIPLGEDESTVVQFEIPNSSVEKGTIDITVSANNTKTEELEFDSDDGVPDTVLNATYVPDSAAVGADLNGANVTVENDGNMTAFERVTLSVDGTKRATWDVIVPPNDEKNITKNERNVTVGDALPTGNTGTHELEFSGRIATNTPEIDPFTVGENGNFVINSVSPPTDVDAGTTVTVSATVENTGAKSLQDDITIEIRNEDTNSLVASTTDTPDLLGTASPAGPESATVSLDTTLNTVGDYSYRVATPNSTQSGQFYVGPQSGPNVVVTSLSVSDNPVDLGKQTTFDVEVTNTGTESAVQTVWLNNSETDETIDRRRDINLNSGESEAVSWTVVADTDQFINGTNRLNVSTENVTLPTSLIVKDPERFSTNAGTITIEESVNASITMEGAELEYNGFDWDLGWYETSAPVEVTLVIENSTGTYERVLWEDVSGTGENVNQPLAEARMFRDGVDNPYTEFLSLEPGTELSLYATSYRCYDDRYSGIEHERDRRSYRGYECTNRGNLRLDISNETNPNNVVIRGNGDKVPKYDAAYPGQLTLDQMLGPSQIEEVDGDGVLELDQNEEVFLFELSDQNAFPGSETQPVVGDYNDAIARFEVIENNRTVTTPARFEIIDIDVPARVDRGNPATMDVTVRNTGGAENSTPVKMSFDNNAQVESKTTDPLGNNETDTVTFTLDTDSRPTGTYDWVVSATKTDNAEQSGFVTVGNPARSFFQVSAVAGPSVADTDDSPEAAVTIANTGSVDDTQTVVLEAKNEDTGGPWTQIDSQTLAIDSGNSKDITLDLPSTKANYSYRVATENVTTSPLSLLVGQSNVYVPADGSVGSINIGSKDYAAGSLIERKGDIPGMNVELANNGTVGDTREVRLIIRNASNGEVLDENVTKQVGGGDLTGQGPVPAYVNYNAALGTGFYTYTITVYNDTAADGVGYEVSGDMYLREGSSGNESDSSPVSIDSGTITVG